MQRTLRINTLSEQDNIRRADTKNMTPDERVQATIELQARFLRWDLHPKIERTAKLRTFNFKNVE